MLFPDDGIQADPPDSEPVFVLADCSAESADDFIQPDAPDDAGQWWLAPAAGAPTLPSDDSIEMSESRSGQWETWSA